MGGTFRDRWSRVPTFLKWWIAAEIAAFAGGFIDPDPRPIGVKLGQIAFWGLIAYFLALGIYRHSRVAWGVALVLHALGLFFSISWVNAPGSDADTAIPWGVWAAVTAFAQGVILLSPSARAWIHENRVPA